MQELGEPHRFTLSLPSLLCRPSLQVIPSTVASQPTRTTILRHTRNRGSEMYAMMHRILLCVALLATQVPAGSAVPAPSLVDHGGDLLGLLAKLGWKAKEDICGWDYDHCSNGSHGRECYLCVVACGANGDFDKVRYCAYKLKDHHNIHLD